MNLTKLMNDGVVDIIRILSRFYLKNRKGQKFMFRMASELHKSNRIRDEYEQNEIHIPPFLIASIATQCNLHCSGCYARAGGSCGDHVQEQMSVDEWRRIFKEAYDLGISFILIAGGEPLLRRDVIEMATEFENIFFPIFTNGTVIDEKYLNLFDTYRNLIPVLSIEGDEMQTDIRRGEGISEILKQAMDAFNKKGIMYGVSVTVTSENQHKVTENIYLESLRNNGCGLIFYVEYVPVDTNTKHLVLSENDLCTFQDRINDIRKNKNKKGMIILSFPGDEDAMGGCLAAGRGFFHINPNGGAEPCPFSPFSELNLKEKSIINVIQSKFFEKVRTIGAREALNHRGGCTLFLHENEVMQAMNT